MKFLGFVALTCFYSYSALANIENGDFNIGVKQQNAVVFHEQSAAKNEFNYGYQVQTVNDQFQFKTKGPDDVTYGCYGYADPNNNKHLVFYVADRLGYRILAQNQKAKIYTFETSHDGSSSDGSSSAKEVAWTDLYLPESCRKLNDLLTLPTAASTVSATVQTGSIGSNAGASSSVQYPTGSASATGSASVSSDWTPYGSGKQQAATTIVQKITTTTSRATTTVPSTTVPTTTTTRTTTTTTPQPPQPTTPEFVFRDESSSASQTSSNNDEQVPNPGNFNGYVFPINGGDCATSQKNVQDLLAQMEALNSQVLTITSFINSQKNGGSSANCAASCWQKQPSPLLIYVPILLPFSSVDSISVSADTVHSINPASFTHQSLCKHCK
ncbi:uncharacterized protein LOC129749079 [Uranotaenia lowii]|uniref:uncharacterized protein LOC129749079 n=1 Tax=Uranotaenia lowii TaxID=190385 RepID=UPI0024797955|nr:uncharacterized protein LOC129749079 [Uranotaenia lowii]